MDQETFNALMFMVLGLGYFSFSMRILRRDHRETWERRMQEMREFGTKRFGRDADKVETPPSPKKK